ncbi:Hsp20/alpha crystallin family protein [Pontibacter chinhatensis]|uniref:HSP20 family protein n=1 Tax=Pontibacter chinhatensis TaxID=1436961 RepID=A0A1I2VPS1_9BACT|nr:Hsp20/alpha crystallin family protein [Pontibacter chinhatensis]SFG90429.1 HSP20 family protein [Pontibacter chinhatensis]
MALTRYNSMQDSMPSTFSAMLDRFFNDTVNSRTFSGFTPHVDACETEHGYEIEVALPGVKKEDITIDFQEGKLTITGERRLEKKEEGRRFHMMETQYGSFSRSFFLPDNVNPDKITAEFRDGILLVDVPKDEKKTKKRQISIAAGNTKEVKAEKKEKAIAENGTGK